MVWPFVCYWNCRGGSPGGRDAEFDGRADAGGLTEWLNINVRQRYQRTSLKPLNYRSRVTDGKHGLSRNRSVEKKVHRLFN